MGMIGLRVKLAGPAGAGAGCPTGEPAGLIGLDPHALWILGRERRLLHPHSRGSMTARQCSVASNNTKPCPRDQCSLWIVAGFVCVLVGALGLVGCGVSSGSSTS